MLNADDDPPPVPVVEPESAVEEEAPCPLVRPSEVLAFPIRLLGELDGPNRFRLPTGETVVVTLTGLVETDESDFSSSSEPLK